MGSIISHIDILTRIEPRTLPHTRYVMRLAHCQNSEIAETAHGMSIAEGIVETAAEDCGHLQSPGCQPTKYVWPDI